MSATRRIHLTLDGDADTLNDIVGMAMSYGVLAEYHKVDPVPTNGTSPTGTDPYVPVGTRVIVTVACRELALSTGMTGAVTGYGKRKGSVLVLWDGEQHPRPARASGLRSLTNG